MMNRRKFLRLAAMTPAMLVAAKYASLLRRIIGFEDVVRKLPYTIQFSSHHDCSPGDIVFISGTGEYDGEWRVCGDTRKLEKV